MHHDFRRQPIQGRRCAARPHQIGVALILEDRHAVLLCQRDHLVPPVQRHHGPGRVLDRRDGVDEFGPHPLGLQIREDAFQRIHFDAVFIHRHGDDLRPRRRKTGNRTRVTKLLQQHRVAGIKEQPRDHIDRLAGPCGDQHIVRRRIDAAMALQLVRHHLAQARMPHRPLGEVIHRQIAALPSDDRRRGGHQPLDRDFRPVVMPADEIIARQPAKTRRWGGQVFCQ